MDGDVTVELRSQMIHLYKMSPMLLWHVRSRCGSYPLSFLSVTPDLFCYRKTRLSFSLSPLLLFELSSANGWVTVGALLWKSIVIFCLPLFLILSFRSFIFYFSLPFITLWHWCVWVCVCVFYSPCEMVCVISVIGSHGIVRIAHTEKENTDTNMHSQDCSQLAVWHDEEWCD